MSQCDPTVLYKQLQDARKLRYVKSIDALVETKNPVLYEPCQALIGLTDMCDFPQNSTRLYVRFCPSVQMEKIQEIKAYIQSKYGFECQICQWSLPIRLDIHLV